MPPTSSPIDPPAALTAEYRPIALLRGGPSAKVVMSNDRTVGAITAAPIPWRARVATSHVDEGASPPAREAPPKRSRPATKIDRRPKMSPRRPPSRSKPPNANA